MFTLQVFLLGLLITSTLTGLVTEAVKKVLVDFSKTYRANTLSGLVALILSLAVGTCYILFKNIGFTSQSVVGLIILIFSSWLCAMVGYDKVMQAVTQFQTYGKNGGVG